MSSNAAVQGTPNAPAAPNDAGRECTETEFSAVQGALSWAAQITVATILAQTLYFKFTAAEESVYIFTTLGAEPWGRIGSGIVELIACVLILWPRSIVYGALLAVGVMAGAIMSHLTRLGIVVQDDGGLLFGLALTTTAAALLVLFVRRKQLPRIGRQVLRL